MSTVGRAASRGIERLTAAGSESPRLVAELLLGFAVGVDRTGILAHPDAPVGGSTPRRLPVRARTGAAGEPVAYIRGIKEFYGLAFTADPRASSRVRRRMRLVELAEAEVMRRLARPPVRPARHRSGSSTSARQRAVAVALVVALRRRRADAR